MELPMKPADDALDVLTTLIAKAKRLGAEAADAILHEGAGISHIRRLGAVEKLERAEGYDLGLRVLVGKRQATVSSNDRSAAALDELAERALAMAKVVPEDPYCGLADPSELARQFPALDICDPVEPAAEVLLQRAAAAEETARAVPGITNSEGAEASWGRSRVALAASNGFAGSYESSGHQISVVVVAGEGTGMERDYEFSAAVYAGDLTDASEIGRSAGERAVKRLRPRKVASQKVPIVFDPRVARGMLGHLVGAINGAAIARGTSFLKDKLGQRIFAPGISVIDDPHRQRGLRSKPFDGEGLPNRRTAFVQDGILTTWILDLRSARQLGLKSTGHASRGSAAIPGASPTNLWLERGKLTPQELMADIKQGLYVSELMGMGVNGITGDYSRGAAGFWIENGALAYPVSEVTVASNLKDMFLNLTPASDLQFKVGMDAPTIRVEGMTVAGT